MSTDNGRYRRVYANEWHDPAFRRLNDGARVVRLYVSAGPQTTSVGCFRLSTAVAVEDLGGTTEAFEQHLETVCQAFDWGWDPLARVVWVSNWFDINPPASPNVVASWAKLMRNVPDCDVRTKAIVSILKSLKHLPASFREPWQELYKVFSSSESQPQIRPETNQGSEIRDQRSEKQRAGALRALAATKANGKENVILDARMLKIAREVIHEGPREPTQDYLVEVFKTACERELGIKVTEGLAMQALAASQQGQTA